MVEIVALVLLGLVIFALLGAIVLMQRARDRETTAWREVLAARSLAEYAQARTKLAQIDLKRVGKSDARPELKSDPYTSYLNDDRRSPARGSDGP